MKGSVAVVLFFLAGVPGAFAQSTMDPERAYAWSPNIGWVDWHPSEEHGAVIGEFVCSGYLWAPNAGWIHLGDGEPEDGVYYSNTAAEDYGVNRRERGRLRGLAWSPNIGWVVFHDRGDPRVDPVTGELSGYAWMPNAGWLRLGELFDAAPGVVTRSVEAGASSADDGIPDAWRIRYGGSVDSLPADEDSSGDGMTNREAYLAGLDPVEPDARFAVVETRFERSAGGDLVTVEWTGSPDRTYRVLRSEDFVNWEPVGPSVLVMETPRYIVGFTESIEPEDLALVRNAGGDIRQIYPVIDALSASLPESAVRDLLAYPRVSHIGPAEEAGTGCDANSVSSMGRFTHTLTEGDSTERAFYRVEVRASPLLSSEKQSFR